MLYGGGRYYGVRTKQEFCLGDWVKSEPLFQNILIFWRPGVDIFAEIIKIVTMFIKTITKDSRKVKIIRNYVSKSNLYVYFLM